MDRPASIIRFEQLYIAHIAIGIIGTALTQAGSSADAVNEATATIGPWLRPTLIVIPVVTQLILLYAIARRGSAIAKWALVVFAALNVAITFWAMVTLVGVADLSSVNPLVLGLTLLATALLIAAVALILRPEARDWFGATGAAA